MNDFVQEYAYVYLDIPGKEVGLLESDYNEDEKDRGVIVINLYDEIS